MSESLNAIPRRGDVNDAQRSHIIIWIDDNFEVRHDISDFFLRDQKELSAASTILRNTSSEEQLISSGIQRLRRWCDRTRLCCRTMYPYRAVFHISINPRALITCLFTPGFSRHLPHRCGKKRRFGLRWKLLQQLLAAAKYGPLSGSFVTQLPALTSS